MLPADPKRDGRIMNDEKVIVIDTDGCEEPTKITKELISEVCERLSKVNEDLQESMQKFLEDVKDVDLSAVDPEDRQFILNTREMFKKMKLKRVSEIKESDKRKRPPLPAIDTYALMNDKINHTLVRNGVPFYEEIDGNGNLKLQCKINQGKNPANKKPVVSGIALTYEGAQLSKKINAFDLSVYNAISTNFFYWNKSYPGECMLITPQEVWRTMNGKTGSETPTDEQVKKVVKSIEKMSTIRCEIDLSEEINANMIKNIDNDLISGGLRSNLLYTSYGWATTEKGVKIEGFQIKEEPILYTYNSIKNHLIYFEYNLLDTSDEIGNTSNVIEFRNYLIIQIQLMKSKRRNNNRILFDTIYEYTGIDSPEKRVKREKYSSESSYKNKIRQERLKDKGKILAVLRSWKKKDNFISDFAEVKKGNSVIGVDIIF